MIDLPASVLWTVAYEPIEIEQLAGDILQGRSDVLGLDIRWHNGRLEWHDPETGRHIVTLDDERARAEDESARADNERTARLRAEARKPRARGGAAATSPASRARRSPETDALPDPAENIAAAPKCAGLTQIALRTRPRERV